MLLVSNSVVISFCSIQLFPIAIGISRNFVGRVEVKRFVPHLNSVYFSARFYSDVLLRCVSLINSSVCFSVPFLIPPLSLEVGF